MTSTAVASLVGAPDDEEPDWGDATSLASAELVGASVDDDQAGLTADGAGAKAEQGAQMPEQAAQPRQGHRTRVSELQQRSVFEAGLSAMAKASFRHLSWKHKEALKCASGAPFDERLENACIWERPFSLGRPSRRDLRDSVQQNIPDHGMYGPELGDDLAVAKTMHVGHCRFHH